MLVERLNITIIALHGTHHATRTCQYNTRARMEIDERKNILLTVMTKKKRNGTTNKDKG